MFRCVLVIGIIVGLIPMRTMAQDTWPFAQGGNTVGGEEKVPKMVSYFDLSTTREQVPKLTSSFTLFDLVIQAPKVVAYFAMIPKPSGGIIPVAPMTVPR